jgi:HK97 gp10 family phage protein
MTVDVSQLLGLADQVAQSSAGVKVFVAEEVAKTVEQITTDAKAKAPKLTGALAASIVGASSGLTGLVETDLRYSDYVENGTGHGPPQPYMAPAADTADGTFPPAVEAAVIKAMNF